MLGHVYDHTPGTALTQNAASCGPYGLIRRTCKTRLDSAALQKSRLWDQSRGFRWEFFWATVVWMAGRYRRA